MRSVIASFIWTKSLSRSNARFFVMPLGRSASPQLLISSRFAINRSNSEKPSVE